MKLKTYQGVPFPLGATIFSEGVNFSIFSKHALEVILVLFPDFENFDEIVEIPLHPQKNRTGDIWHIFVENLGEGIRYGYRIDGPYAPSDGHRFNKFKLLIDPYAKLIDGVYNFNRDELYGYQKTSEYKDLSFNYKSSIFSAPKSVTVKTILPGDDDYHLNFKLNELIIYEMHVRGFTKHPSSGVKNPGTFDGIIEKIDYLKSLGVNAIELMPIHEFNPDEIVRKNPLTNEPLKQYWGYNTINFFTPAFHYSVEPLNRINEFRNFVKQCHNAGIEVILDVVYNHTGEGGEDGPTLSFRGIDNSVYYMLDKNNKRLYKNYSGCGNTFNCNYPVVKQFIIDSLRYWYCDLKIDGFRFDLATILGRNPEGEWVGENSLLNDILNDPLLSGCKLIAEGWDAAGLYKLGDFPEGWAEWNGKYRDSVRRFIRGDNGVIHDFINAFIGSPDLYGSYKSPDHSINFITCHDGFTLRDLVSYNNKHNIENGENNLDGSNENFSYNWGHEGETSDEYINKIRNRNVKNFLTVLFFSLGVPMIYSGDECYRTQRGNNNAYCHDTMWNWFNWENLEKYSDILRFSQKIINFRRRYKPLQRKNFYNNKNLFLSSVDEIWNNDISFHGININNPDLADWSHTIAFLINGKASVTGLAIDYPSIYIAINAYEKELEFNVPPFLDVERKWYILINTYNDAPFDFNDKPVPWNYTKIPVKPHSVVVLICGKKSYDDLQQLSN